MSKVREVLHYFNLDEYTNCTELQVKFDEYKDKYDILYLKTSPIISSSVGSKCAKHYTDMTLIGEREKTPKELEAEAKAAAETKARNRAREVEYKKQDIAKLKRLYAQYKDEVNLDEEG